MKKFFKGFTATAAALALTLGAAACGGGNAESEQGEVDSEGNTIVSIMFHVDEKSAEGVAYKKRVNEFNKAYASQKIRASASYQARTAGAADYEQKLIGLQNEGDLPDIITFDAPNCASYAASGLLYDISALVPQDVQDDFWESSLNKYQGKLYGLPIQESSAGFFYNKKIFRDAGIDVSAYTVDSPWTFDQFKSVCATLKEKITFEGFMPVDMRLDATKDETATYLLYPFIYAAGGEFVSADGYTATGYFNGAGANSGFSFLKDLVNGKYTSYDIGAKDFVTGKTGMYLSSGWTIPDLNNDYKDLEWGLLPYPKGVNAASATGSWSFAITENHHSDKTATKELLMWMTTAESSKGITDATGMIPARKSVETNYVAGSPEDILLKQLGKTGRTRPVTVGYPQFSNAFKQVISGMKNGDLNSIISAQTNVLQTELDKLQGLFGK